MIMRWGRAFKHIAEATGVAHLDEPICHRSRNAIVEPVETATLPWDWLLYFRLALYIVNITASNAETYLRSNTQP